VNGKNSWRSLVLLLILLGGVSLAADPAPIGRFEQVQIGMTAKQVEDLLGPPTTTARQIFSQGTLVQWIYERPERGRITLRQRLGEEPHVIQRPARQRP
jgi:hypothetical protein